MKAVFYQSRSPNFFGHYRIQIPTVQSFTGIIRKNLRHRYQISICSCHWSSWIIQKVFAKKDARLHWYSFDWRILFKTINFKLMSNFNAHVSWLSTTRKYYTEWSEYSIDFYALENEILIEIIAEKFIGFIWVLSIFY